MRVVVVAVCVVCAVAVAVVWSVDDRAVTSVRELRSPVDVQGHWAQEVIVRWVDNGWVRLDDDRFYPDAPIDRVTFVSWVNRAFRFVEEQSGFSDVEPLAPYAIEVRRARAQGYVSGYADGTFRPLQAMTRQEVALALSRIGKLDTDLSVVKRFRDYGQFEPWSEGAIGAVVGAGYMMGYADGSFLPAVTMKRAEVLVTLHRMLPDRANTALYDVPGVFGPETGALTVDGDMLIETDGIGLRKMNVSGDVIIAPVRGEGIVTLEGITVAGDLRVRGSDRAVVVRMNGGSASRVLLTASTVSMSARTDRPLSVSLDADASEQSIVLDGAYDTLYISGTNQSVSVLAGTTIDVVYVEASTSGCAINLARGAAVRTLRARAPCSVTGEGTVIDNTSEVRMKRGDTPSVSHTGSGNAVAVARISGTLTGLAVPVAGASPQQFLDTPSVSGSVVWRNGAQTLASDALFAPGIAYTADVSLTAKSGFAFAYPVAMNGAVSTTLGTGTETTLSLGALYPATAQTLPGGSIQAVVPRTGARPSTQLPETATYTASVQWFYDGGPNVPPIAAPERFVRGTAYTARMTMYPKSGYTTVGMAANAYTVTGALSSTQEQAIITATFSPTDDMVYVPLQSVTSVPLGVFDHIVAGTFAPYVIGRNEVTYREWVETKQWATAYTFVSSGREGSAGIDGAPPTVAIDHPVTHITWADALVWTNAHSERNGLTPVYRDASGGVLRNAHTVTASSVIVAPNDGYRLPTSVEWEVASRWLGAAAPSVAPLSSARIAHAGLFWTPGTYASGATASTSDALSTQIVAQYTHTIASPMTSASSVRSKAPNALELYDMSGNVWEWVQDAIDGEPMMRGGGFRDLGSSIRIGHFASSTTAADDIGMRLVRSVHP